MRHSAGKRPAGSGPANKRKDKIMQADKIKWSSDAERKWVQEQVATYLETHSRAMARCILLDCPYVGCTCLVDFACMLQDDYRNDRINEHASATGKDGVT